MTGKINRVMVEGGGARGGSGRRDDEKLPSRAGLSCELRAVYCGSAR